MASSVGQCLLYRASGAPPSKGEFLFILKQKKTEKKTWKTVARSGKREIEKEIWKGLEKTGKLCEFKYKCHLLLSENILFCINGERIYLHDS